ncbi:MAG TPA: DUF3160 domain-containing protein, partial [bacterium]|nr:DUF3160 domain-containing protein [bacterium]
MRRRALDLCRMIARKWARAASLALAALICAALAVSGLMGEAWGLGAPGSPAKSGGGATASKPNQTSTFANYFQYSPVQVAYKAPAYALPLKAIDISNFDQVTALGLGTDAQALLLKNGFVATSFTPSPDCADVVEAYKMLARGQVPVLVTSGSLFHTYHVLFDYTLSTIESGQLYGNIWAVSLGLFTKSYDAYRNSSGDAKEAALRDAAYLAVGLSLLMPEESPGGQPSGGPEGPGARGVRSPRISPGPGGLEGSSGQGREFTDQDRATYRFEVPA